jgi:Fe-S cluster biogenesis protein NfuA
MADGGNVEFVEIDGLVVKLKLAGACGSCPSSMTTMTMGIKRRLMEKIPVSSRARPAAQAGSCTGRGAPAGPPHGARCRRRVGGLGG